jgi:hypothetical protein
LLALTAKIKTLNGGVEPLLFFPRAETIEASIKSTGKSSYTSRLAETIVGVDGDVFNPDYTSPGYVVDYNGQLTFYDNISEDYAWENDVWVIGYEEDVPNISSIDDDLVALSTNNLASRYQGQSEYGGIIQVTDLNAIEPWTAGKLEFKILIYAGNGTLMADKSFDKRKRSHFRNNNWYDYGFFIGNWNTTTFGNWTTEKWMELDGGKSSSVTFNIPAATPGGIATSITVPSQERDDDLGLATIQFTDEMLQVYSVSHANIRRKH